MIGHLGLNVPDLAAAKAYYDDLMELFDFELAFSTPKVFAYRPGEGRPGTTLLFYLASSPAAYDRHAVGLQHLAFAVKTRSAVRRAHERAVSLGSTILDPPQEFPQYPPPYYAAFWLDPHGFKLEAVCHHDLD